MELFFPGELRSKERVRAVCRGGFAALYTPKETEEAEDAIRERVLEWREQQGWTEPHEGPVVFRLYCLFRRTKEWFPLREHVGRPDWDNLGKTFSDAIQNGRRKNGKKEPVLLEGVIRDDGQIIDARVIKTPHETPGALLVVKFLEPAPRPQKVRAKRQAS